LLVFLFSFVTLFTACNDDSPVAEEETPSVSYSDNWRFLTIYLDNPNSPVSVNANQKVARAMTPDNARWGFDFFEVVFYYKGTSTRTRWGLGERAFAKNVYTTESGIDYSATSIEQNSTACAVLFAGRGRSDRTLLALGKIVFVDDEVTAVIKDTSSAVTFELSILTSAVSSDPEKSSFLTNAKLLSGDVRAENTNIIDSLLGFNRFPLFVVPTRKITKAEYKFGLEGKKYSENEDDLEGGDLSGEGDLPGGDLPGLGLGIDGVIGEEVYTWDDFKGSIVVAEPGITHKRTARYPFAGTDKFWYPRCAEDTTTVVTMTNNQIPNKTADTAITFEIDTMKTHNNADPKDNGLFSFAFTIPVYAILIPPSAIAAAAKPGEEPWNIRPAYESHYYNIDNGETKDGAILVGAGIIGWEYELPVDMR
jgi:hypothetical protein